MVLFQSYQISSRLISQEVVRTSKQTSSLIQSLFDFRLATLQIHQDSSAKNSTLVQAIHSGKEVELDQYFLTVDQLELSNTPDIRFITSQKDMLWDDGNSQFYGIETKELGKIVRRVSISSNWHLIKSPSQLGPTYLLVRRSSIVDPATGEVLGFLYVSIVLNDNYALIETIKDNSNAQNLVLAVDDNVLASTLNGNELYTTHDIIHSVAGESLDDKNIVSKNMLEVEGVPTYLSVFSVQSNQNALKLRDSYYFWIVFALIALLAVTIVTRWWLHRNIKREIDQLMSYTHKVAVQGKEYFFPGSAIYEFDHFGRTLENTFQRLAEQEKQFEDLFNFSLTPIILWSTDGYIIRMNPAAQKEFIGSKGESKRLFRALEKQLVPDIQTAATGDISKEVMTEIDKKVFRWSISPIVIENKIESIITQGQDVTSFAEAEKQSRIARKEAEESARVRADFLAKMSHELRTPLNGILGVSQLLKRSVTNPEQIDQINVLCSSGEHLLAVLNDILDFSKIEQGQFRIANSEFPLINVVCAIEQIYKPMCDDKGLEFKLESDIDAAVVVNSNQVRLNQILYNIINNALKFTCQGMISVRLSLQYGDPDQLHVTVKDTGIGIKESDLKIIFEPFMQAEPTTTREYGGSGLGLTIVHSLVEMLGGTIKVSSEFGQGTEFNIYLPLEVVSRKTNLATKQEETKRFALFNKTLKVLLVEDNHTNAFIAKAFCEKYGMKVEWVKDGMQAIEKAKSEQYDIVLMDNQLPFLDGVDATKVLKQEMQLSTPVFACTADGMESTQQAFLAAGAEYVIVKPIREDSLYRALLHYKENYC
uniref:Autoinducer 2 sensor kinase/phosphatase LuxQ n=2 Tax=Vibrio ziniensis TaxID=2711221 RepID=A0A6G7CR78_9VIBR|nr:quorum-sensing autoinducer 2 sensor kinase/phosphatase LuxQ [Vibrio ziniensis]QIH44563.1 response regulator [Vibrio ziniensis]